MVRQLGIVFGYSAALGLALGWSDLAQACSPPLPDLVHVPRSVPQDGLIVGQLWCLDCSTDDLIFRTQDEEIEGTFEVVTAFDDTRFFAFRPSEMLPLTNPEDYQSGVFVKVADQLAVEHRIVVTTPGDTEPSAKASVSPVQEAAGTTYACGQSSSSSLGMCGIPTYSSQTSTRAALQISLENGSQYLYRATYTAGEELKEFQGVFEDVDAHVFDSAGQEVCYALVRVAVDGSENLVAEDCLSTTGLDLGISDQPFGDPDETLMTCVVPPAGQEPQWCAYFAEAIDANDCEGFFVDSCEAALASCDDETDETTGEGGQEPEETSGQETGGNDTTTSTEQDTAGDDTAGEESTMAVDGSDGTESPSSGCAVSRPAAGGSWPSLLILLAFAGLVRRREQARRAA